MRYQYQTGTKNHRTYTAWPPWGKLCLASDSDAFSCLQLLDTKSTDRKMTLLHYIALIVKEKYPELAIFPSELHFVDKAASGKLVVAIF